MEYCLFKSLERFLFEYSVLLVIYSISLLMN